MEKSRNFAVEQVLRAMEEATKLLGYTSLRANQALVIEKFVSGSGNDVFVSMPTGSGKSLCYCLLPKVFDILLQKVSCEAQQGGTYKV